MLYESDWTNNVKLYFDFELPQIIFWLEIGNNIMLFDLHFDMGIKKIDDK